MSTPDDPWATPPADGSSPHPPNNPYGEQPPAGYGQPAAQAPYPGPPGYGGAPGYGYVPIAPKHPQATTALVLGLVSLVGGLVVCGIPLLVSPFAWIIGGRAVKEIDAAPQMYSGRDQAQAGRVMGIIGTVLLVIAIIGLVAFITVIAATDFSETTYDTNV